ncbi:HEAT repeat domain-containing protein [Phaeovibrio sulfidiphilus]|uniref:HEAT repeat domain-containing protein n=1 Tax=Phaeovibrio sulfidiphilus TaxID=1220600 RepID=A0A8J6YMP4_9PROT|nr:HEAT repeat domain-containing protein [Phaeovibrio sulfidiphilus]MBE1237295.1 HEAT repeat domain-containing protein [Phaeovibrio sulfidiphilus]
MSTRNTRFPDMVSVAGSLWDTRPDERHAAALAAASYPDTVPLLVARLRVEKDTRVFGALESALVAIGSDAVVMGVLPLLRAPEPAVRIVGADILRVLGARSEPVVRALLTDESPALRTIGVTIARDLPNPEVSHWLESVLARDQDPGVCRAALDALASMATPSLVPVLHQVEERFPEVSDLRESVHYLLGLLDLGNSNRNRKGECA